MFALIVRVLCFLLVLILILVITQDVQIFPGLLSGLGSRKGEPTPVPHPAVSSFFVETAPGVALEVWALPGEGESRCKTAVLIAHGNGGALPMFFSLQSWLRSLGISSYGFDYRGYGASNGWPSEQKLLQDAEVVFQEMLRREELRPEQAVLLGVSIGAGSVAYLAQKYHPRALVLLSPFVSIPAMLEQMPLLRYLKPFLWYRFPVAEQVAMLKATALVVAHGRLDTVVPFAQGEAVANSYSGDSLQTIFVDAAGHNDLFPNVQQQLANALRTVCSND